jgi:hypothetical protein
VSSSTCFHDWPLSCSDDEEPPACATAAPSISPAAIDEPAKPAVAVRTTRSTVKKVSQSQSRNLKRAKKTKEAEVSLEAHVSTVSSDDVSDSCFPSLAEVSLEAHVSTVSSDDVSDSCFPSFLFRLPFSEVLFSFRL